MPAGQLIAVFRGEFGESFHFPGDLHFLQQFCDGEIFAVVEIAPSQLEGQRQATEAFGQRRGGPLNQSADVNVYTLSLGHMTDLTLRAFAYLRAPLALAGVAFAIGAVGAWRRASTAAAPMAVVAMMVLFFHAARMALVVFDPYMGSRALAEALMKSPAGTLVVDDQYYTFSSVFFYTDRRALLLNGRLNNLVYGSYAPDAPQGVFIDDHDFQQRWRTVERYYVVAEGPQVPRFQKLVGKDALHTVAASGGKFLFTNQGN